MAMLLGTACGDDDENPDPGPVVPPAFEATIKRTAYGIPHIEAKDYGGLGYGQGYASAQDHVCILSDQIAKVRGERARFQGQGNGSEYAASDFAWLALGIHARAEATFKDQPQEVQDVLKGFAAGYNRYIAETSPAELPAPCTNADWVRPIDAVDMLAYDYSLALTGSAYQIALAIAAAEPPTVSGGSVGVPGPEMQVVNRPEHSQVGSNGWAIGGERSSTGGGMVLANPHFPWEGELKLWERHLTIPGQLNMYGVGLLGVPAVLIGFNNDIAWTHTFSVGQRMTLYGLKLAPGKPTTYMYDGQEREMTYKDITILVKLPEGSLTNVTRRMYFSHYGPIIVIPGLAEWTTQSVLTFRDANIENNSLLSQFMFMNKAKSLDEFKAVYAEKQGIPWVNTMFADRGGNTWFTDASPTPALLPPVLDGWVGAIRSSTPNLAAVIFQQTGLTLLDGSISATEWQNVAGARSPGLVPFSGVPQLSRRDFVYNANDSHWLTNPAQPLTGFSPMHGFERVPQTPRTRMNARLLTEVSATGASGADGKFTLTELQNAIFSNRSSNAEDLKAELVTRCKARTTPVPYNGNNIDITHACAVLEAWSGRFDLDAVGAVLWREFVSNYGTTQLAQGGTLYAVPFNADEPITTPNTLAAAPASGEDPVLVSFARAVYRLGLNNVSIDKPLGELQFTTRTGTRIPLHGGLSNDGLAQVVSWGNLKSSTSAADFSAVRPTVQNGATGLTKDGYYINNGSSFIMTMEFSGATDINAAAVLTYSESSDKASPHYGDQTLLFSQKQWRPILFTDAAINGDPGLKQEKISGN